MSQALARWRSMVFLISTTALLAVGCNHQESDKDVMAKVNGYKVLRAEVDKAYNRQVAGSPQKSSAEEEQALRLNILRQIIDDQLHLQKAEKLGIMATDDEVETRFAQAKAPYTKEEFEKKLKELGLTEEDSKQQIRRNLTLEKLLNKEIGAKVTISEFDIQSFYNMHKAEFNLIEPQYILAHIFIHAQPGPNKVENDAQARKNIESIHNRLDSGEDFATLAAKSSEDPDTARNGGEMPPVPESSLKTLDAATRDAVQKLKPGQYSGILPAINPQSHQQEGYRIVKLVGKEQQGQRDLSDTAVQQWIRNQLRGQREQVLKMAYDETLRDGAEIHNYYAEQIVKNAQK